MSSQMLCMGIDFDGLQGDCHELDMKGRNFSFWDGDGMLRVRGKRRKASEFPSSVMTHTGEM